MYGRHTIGLQVGDRLLSHPGGGGSSELSCCSRLRNDLRIGFEVKNRFISYDGRKISIGDCALFKPPQDSPPFVGIIRWLALKKENNLHLGVNWLYRPAEVKLCRGILLDAPPNEVFYSFHKDEIPAASLLHPCKVAFLPKGVEIPVGVSSFVCRRVYDIANKCLWWLTDQDFIDDRQEEVDKLLHKTRIEMHPTVQPGGRSPKPIHGPTSTSQLKSGSDNMQNANPFSSQAKGKKRERSDQGTLPVKRERSSMTEDGDSTQFKPENILRSEISKITEDGGGLLDPEGAEKLVQLMQPDRAERKMELISRSMLASVIASTEKFDCLSRFVQLKGLSVLDEWLQDAHKGKIGDGSPKDGDKSVEEFLLVLLRGLDRLPVNLHALQTCNIGKSVNHLRSHKNLEIQRKARGLVDTWKKRVEAEMNVIDTKPGSAHAVSWPSRSRLPEVSHDGNRTPGGSTDVVVKSSVTQLSASKTASVKPAESEFTAKSTSSSPGTTKSAVSPASGKESHPRVVVGGTTSDLPSATAREDRSSSSSQSHNNSPCLGKEDPKSSTAGSMTVNKVSGGSSRQRRSVNGFSGPAVSGGQRDSGSTRNSSVHRNSGSEKLSVSGFTGEKALDVPNVEGNGHKLIVKIPNRGRSPGQSGGGGSVDHASNMNSRASSPMLSEKHDQSDRSSREKIDADRANTTYDVNAESWQSNDVKDLLTGSDEGDGSPAATLEEERRNIGEEAVKSKFDFDSLLKLAEVSRAASSSSGYELKLGKSHGASFSSVNALVERCVKYSEANPSVTVGDDVRMNLLASVAAGEMCRSDLISQTDSPCRNTPMVEESSMGDDTKSQISHGINADQEQSQSADGAQHLSKQTSGSISRDGKTSSSIRELAPTGESNEYHSSNSDLQTAAEPHLEMNERSNELRGAASIAVSLAGAGEMNKNNEKLSDGDRTEQIPSPGKVHSEHLERSDEDRLQDSFSSKGLPSENVDELNGGKADEVDPRSHVRQAGKQKSDYGTNSALSNDNKFLSYLGSAVSDQKSEGTEANVESKAVLEHCSGGAAPRKGSPALPTMELEKHMMSRGSKMSGVGADETEESASTAADSSSFTAAEASNTGTMLKFDLNEGFVADEGKCGEPINLGGPGSSASVHLNMFPFPVPSVSSSLPASITVAAAAKGPFVPREELLRSKGEVGWKGSAATSAFRPAEPRKALEMPLGTIKTPPADTTAGRHGRPVLDIDLNVPDERILEDMTFRNSDQETASTSDQGNNRDLLQNRALGAAPVRSSGGLVLDLNLVDEASDMGHYSARGIRTVEAPLLPLKPSSTGGFPKTEVRRDFDLNNGPSVDDASVEPILFSQHGRNIMQSQPPVAGLRMNNAEMGTFSPWHPSGNAYPGGFRFRSTLSDRGEHPFPIVATGGPPRMLGPTTGGTPFTSDVYRGASVLSSSPAVSFPYSGFPFGNSFPLPSATFSGGSTTYMDSSSSGRLSFPTVNSQSLGPVSAVSSQYPRPYVVSLPDGSSDVGIDNSRKWMRQGLDLNAGPGNVDAEGRDETMAFASRQLSVARSQALAEEQARMYQQVAGGVFKRKEPEGWDTENVRCLAASDDIGSFAIMFMHSDSFNDKSLDAFND
ncbi:hypothetical protein C3L33_00732, partial [Rhododendron williamsianum]